MQDKSAIVYGSNFMFKVLSPQCQSATSNTYFKRRPLAINPSVHSDRFIYIGCCGVFETSQD